jgi:hypothetical protein
VNSLESPASVIPPTSTSPSTSISSQKSDEEVNMLPTTLPDDEPRCRYSILPPFASANAHVKIMNVLSPTRMGVRPGARCMPEIVLGVLILGSSLKQSAINLDDYGRLCTLADLVCIKPFHSRRFAWTVSLIAILMLIEQLLIHDIEEFNFVGIIHCLPYYDTVTTLFSKHSVSSKLSGNIDSLLQAKRIPVLQPPFV